MITKQIEILIDQALKQLDINSKLDFLVEKTKDIKLGDFSSNIAFVAAKLAKKNPIDFGGELANILKANKCFKDVSVSKPGFINFFLSNDTNGELIKNIISENDNYGKFKQSNKDVYSVEYVSANPTGYLHIGHARNAVLGNCIVNLLDWTGYNVISEYVVNDAGNQMNNLATAVLIRYQQLCGKDIQLPEDSYHGQEIILVAQALRQKYKDQFKDLIIDDKNTIVDKEAQFTIRWFARDFLLDIIKKDLKDLGVEIQYYYSEYDTHKNNILNGYVKKLMDMGIAYQKDGAVWLKTTNYDDDKDRVLIKSDGNPTYFLPDIYYHEHKLSTHNTKYLIAVWGSDHYSYITRMRAALLSLGYKDEQFKIVCMQMVKLVKDGKEFKMSKRSGKSLTCRDLIDALGKDVARWFLVSQSANNHIEIDVDVATKKDSNNPFYYVQYAYARASALINKQKLALPTNFNQLNSDIERELINELHYFKYTILNAKETYEPYKITIYLLNLAKLFHSFYTNTKIFNASDDVMKQQYALVKAIAQVIKNALAILGIQALERM